MDVLVAVVVGLLIGAVFGAFIAFFSLRAKYGKKQNELESDIRILEHDLESQKTACEVSEQTLRAEFAERTALADAASRKQIAVQEQLLADAEARHQAELSKQEARHKADLESAERLRQEELSKLESRHKADLEAAEKLQQERTDAMRNTFRSMSADILRQQTETFSKSHTEQLNTMLTPLRAQLSEYRESLEKTKADYNKLSGSISEQCRIMIDETKKIGMEADRLTNALTQESKVQGDWGETILEGLLDNSGLIRGVHYTAQDVLRTPNGDIAYSEDGKMMRTDVIVHFPDGKDLIIDSKVSLISYMRYCSVHTPDEQAVALRAHCDSLKKHIDEIAAKRYDTHPQNGRAMIDFTVMFVPVEQAIYTALSAHPELRDYADKRGVCIVTPMNLIAMLRIAKSLWTRADQEKNHLEIIKTAEQLLKRICNFYGAVEGIRKSLLQAQTSCDEAAAVLGMQKGKHSIATAATRLVKLGVKAAPNDLKKLPNELAPAQDDAPFLPGLLPAEAETAEAESADPPENVTPDVPEQQNESAEIIDIGLSHE